jgi:hypothetical protein
MRQETGPDPRSRKVSYLDGRKTCMIADTMDEHALLPEDRMPEAEVALRLAFWLLEHPQGEDSVEVAIDGAQVSTGGQQVFALRDFLLASGWEQVSADPERWQGTYRLDEKRLGVHSRPGVGDVVGTVGGKTIRAECKKGPLIFKTGGPEYPLLREALAQLLTVEEVGEEDVLVAAVPKAARFPSLAEVWGSRPLMRRVDIRIALVGRDGTVDGLDL